MFRQHTKLDPNRFNFRGGRKKLFPLRSESTPLQFIYGLKKSKQTNLITLIRFIVLFIGHLVFK